MTEDLIERLAADLRPVPRHAMRRLLVGGLFAGLAPAVLLMVWWLGLRPDLPQAAAGGVFWIKFSYTAIIALLCLPALVALARPGGRALWPWAAMAVIVAWLAIAAGFQLSSAPPHMVHELVMGSTALGCPFYILGIAAPVLIGMLVAMRRTAPTRPALAGFAAGLLSGAAGAWVYSFHCTEIGLAFLLTWYSLGMVAVSVVGAILGRFVLRW